MTKTEVIIRELLHYCLQCKDYMALSENGRDLFQKGCFMQQRVPKQLNSKPYNNAVDTKSFSVEKQWNKNPSNALTQYKGLSSVSQHLELHIPNFKRVLTTLA